MTIRVFSRLLALASLAAFLFSTPVLAGEAGQWNFEIYGGWYFVGDLEDVEEWAEYPSDALEALGVEPGDDLTYGLRFGRRQTDTWGWQLTGGLFKIDDALERLETRQNLSLELFVFDLSFMYYVGGGNFYLYAGPGFSTLNVDIESTEVEIPGAPNFRVDESESNWSAHAGLGYMFDIGESAYLRLDGRLRYIDSDIYSGETDGETTVAIGWNF